MNKVIFPLVLLFLSGTTLASSVTPEFWNQLIRKHQLDKNTQSFCVSNEQENIFESNLQLKIRPASVSKLYVTDWAMNHPEIGFDYKYQTKILISGKDLWIQGGFDPYFVTESVFYLIKFLNEQNITELDHIYFDQNFFFNWTDTTSIIATELKKYFSTKKWNSAIRLEYKVTQSRIEERNLLIDLSDLNLKVKSVEYTTLKPNTVDQAWTYFSSPLYKHIKQMNVYSTNFYAQKLFELLGNSEEFSLYMNREMNVTKEQMYFYTGSGLGANYTTCEVSEKLVKHLEESIIRSNLKLSDVISVAGVDLGTLRNRFKNPEAAKAVVAKTGTLNDTSTLSGYLMTESGLKYFGIFNHTTDAANAHVFQEAVVKEILKLYPAEQLDYAAIDYLPIEDVVIQ